MPFPVICFLDLNEAIVKIAAKTYPLIPCLHIHRPIRWKADVSRTR